MFNADLADQLVTLVGAGRDLVTKVGLAMLFSPAGVELLAAVLGRFPVLGGIGRMSFTDNLMRQQGGNSLVE